MIFFDQFSYQGKTLDPIFVAESLPFGSDNLETQMQVAPDDWLQSAQMRGLLHKEDQGNQPALPASGQNCSKLGTSQEKVVTEVGRVCPNIFTHSPTQLGLSSILKILDNLCLDVSRLEYINVFFKFVWIACPPIGDEAEEVVS